MANEVRLIDMNTLWQCETCFHHGTNGCKTWCDAGESYRPAASKFKIIDPETLRPKGRWDWKHRHKGGFHKYTGVDAFGETHTITVDERFECDEPYCPNCGKWNESIYLNFCPNCGVDMRGDVDERP